ncbi:sentrin-specific protease [Hirsutella rhossiliensis]|uniref:Sentrin-specific protease n=1 Tax=Hirsutella rhossiliensis TaxID=111463 RepID=A0A9P8N1Z5_9HYPO|nr:sentrin-specific protease [Hirsutella rhossiliensis]KAH0965137.1 sentrin-specific protease [Hirsutella rhossiliensis]
MVGGPQLLKTINGRSAGPVNTLNESHTAKRLRSGGPGPTQTAIASPYFPAPKQAALDLTGSSPLDDPFDLRSTSSSVKTISGPSQNVEEFRNAQLKPTCGSTRKRKSPAHVVSDIQSTSPAKRRSQRSDLTTPPIKTHKPQAPAETICDSEDELSFEPNNNRKRPNNFSGIRQPQRRANLRGDIQPAFSGIPRQHQARLPPHQQAMVIKSAACGKESYESDDQQRKQIILHPSGHFELVPMTANGERSALEWLHINVQTCHILQHAGGKSAYVVIHRSMVGSIKPKLYLEFTTSQGASYLASVLSSITYETKTPYELEVMVRRAMSNASLYAKPPSRLPVYTKSPQEAESNEIPWSMARSSRAANEDNGSRREKITDKMCGPSDNQPVVATEEEDVPSTSNHIQTRRTRRSSPAPVARQQSPDRWTSKNPDWRKNWHRSLVFPATGKNRATVDDDDILRLDEGEFLNDNLISFYLRYLQDRLEKEQPELLKKVYIFSTFFFEKLRSTRGKINYEGVKAWTTKFDLFSHDYVIVPVNEHAHWYLAIICNVPNALGGVPAQADVEVIDVSQDSPGLDVPGPSPKNSARPTQPTSTNPGCRTPSSGGSQKLDPRQPKIVTLDSLGSQHPPTCKALKDYLAEEAKDKKGVDLAVIPNGMKAREIPQQDNFCDCGVFVLGYVEEFLKDPDGVARKLLQKESLGWDMQAPSLLRDSIRALLFDLQQAQQLRLDKEKEEKRRSAAKKKAAKQEKPRSPQSPVTAPQASPKVSSPARDAKAPTAGKGACAEEIKSDSGAEAFFSAQSSPDEKPSKEGATLEKNKPPDDRMSEPKFVTTLPTTPDPTCSGAGSCLGGVAEEEPRRPSYYYDGIDPFGG